MNNCIFCKKQTNNKYSYFVAGGINGAREKMTVFACTKCLSKKSVIILSIITFFFVISLLGNIDQMQSGQKEVETGPIVVISVIIFACLFWTIYKIFYIATDKPLSEASTAKKLIRKAKKINPAKFYFTPAENALSATKNEKQTSTEGEQNLASDTVGSTITYNNLDYSTHENKTVNELPDTSVSEVSVGNNDTKKLVCPKCGSENIKLPSNNTLKIFDKNESNMMNTVMKANLGFLYGIVGDTVLRFKCRNCKHKW